MGIFGGTNFARQQRLTAEQISSVPMSGLGRDEKASRRKAKYAEMAFRISKGYEKDNFATRIKYFFKND